MQQTRLKFSSPLPQPIWLCTLLFSCCSIQTSWSAPNMAGQIARPLHFRPDNGAFLVENGPEWFNRPLYSGNTAFRVDAGDKPELSLYLPGRGGNLRFGLQTAAGQKWLFQAQHVIARYVPGSMRYEIRDPLLGSGALYLDILPMNAAQGSVVRTHTSGVPQGVELVWAFGGANGERASRNGDIGTEKVPISQYFQLKPSSCLYSNFSLSPNTFTLQTKRADIVGLASSNVTFSLADATKWSNLSELLASISPTVTQTPVVVGRAPLSANQPFYLSLERLGGGLESKTAAKASTYKPEDLARVFETAESHRREIAEKVVADTPDPYINAAVGALNVASDGVWDEKESMFMHGAVAWRNKYLGWRGAYAGSELGWPDRTRRHLDSWFARQNVEPVAPGAAEPQVVPPDPSANYARNEPALHSNGDITNSHYDMNMVAMDILFRHLQWTGDLEYARQVWPVIERHMAWERRLFRRPFGPQKLPLYEAYVVIWASDDLQYNGGGVTHASAYNYYHNLEAARLAHLLGKDAAPYEREAKLIQQAMQSQLWLPERGSFAEWKDLLGLQQTHPNAGLWTFYHTLDSQVPTPFEAWQMSRLVDTQTPHFPLEGAGVPPGYFTVSTTNWMPYTWSTNNVVMAEASHASLGYWQASRDETAFRLFKGALLDSMYMGLCPGNVGMTTTLDMARGESQRDFGDGIGATSRALVEGLFGVRPDLLNGEVLLRPGFPASWNHASLKHPQFDLRFEREGLRETLTFAPKWNRPLQLRLQLSALRDGVASVKANGQTVPWKMLDDSVGSPRIEISAPAASQIKIEVVWKGAIPAKVSFPPVIAQNTDFAANYGAATVVKTIDPQKVLGAVQTGGKTWRAKATGTPGHRTVFTQVRQGDLTWWQPLDFEIRPAFEILQTEAQTSGDIRFQVRNNTGRAIDQTATLKIRNRTSKVPLKVAAGGTSREIIVPARGLLSGSNALQLELGRGQAVSGTVTNWKLAAPVDTKYETVALKPLFNDKVTQIFKHEYLSPRSPYTSLAIPKQGYGSWASPTKTFDVNDSGLRATAKQQGDTVKLPQGVPFQTPGEEGAPNIAFTSQWDNFPHAVEVPLQGRASHLYLLMAGSTNSMQSRFENGEVIVTYTDGSTQRLPLENPNNWWPIDQDYKIDDFAFSRPQPIPPRLDLQTGTVRTLDLASFKGKGGKIEGGAATVLDLPLEAGKTLRSLTVRTLANEVVIGLMSATLVRP